MWVIYPLWVCHSLISSIIVRFLRSDGEQRILWHVKRAVIICAEIQITMQVSPFKQWWKCYLQVHEIFSTVNAVFSEFKQILYRCNRNKLMCGYLTPIPHYAVNKYNNITYLQKWQTNVVSKNA